MRVTEGATSEVTAADISRPVTVVCVTYNSASVLDDCLASLSAAMDGVPTWCLVVVDNASADDSVAVARRSAPTATVVVELAENRGYSAGINAGVTAVADPGDLVVINPDVRLAPGSIGLLRAAAREPGMGIAVPRLTGPSGATSPSLRRRPTVLRALGEAVLGGRRAGRVSVLGEVVPVGPAYEVPGTADWATGAVWLVSQECREAVGTWDESFFLYSEETDYALRAADAGFGLTYVPGVTVVHIGGAQDVRPDLWALSMVNRVRLHRLRHGAGRAAAFRAALVLGESLRAGRGAVHRAGLRALLRPGPTVRADRGPAHVAPPESPAPWICFAAQDWWYHNRAHSDFQLMTRLARRRPVLLVNSIGLRMPTPGKSTMVVRRILRKARSVAKFVRRPLPDVRGFTVMTPLVIPLYQHPRIRAFNAAFVRLQVRAVAAVLRIDRPVVFATIPTAGDVLGPMGRRATLYNRSDRHSEFPESDRDTIGEMERHLLRTADRVLYVSRELMRVDSELVGARGDFLDHGVDLEHFRRRPPEQIPADVAAIPGPRIGFFGGLDDYVIDFVLLERLAVAMPGCRLVLVGDATCSMDRLRRLPNVHWLGYREYQEIPAIGSAFDVALMPWLDNDWIKMCNPIKLKEYLALGLPVVSTYYPEVEAYRDYVRVADSHETFIAAVRETLADGGLATPDARRAAVAQMSWDDITDRLERVADAAVSGAR